MEIGLESLFYGPLNLLSAFGIESVGGVTNRESGCAERTNQPTRMGGLRSSARTGQGDPQPSVPLKSVPACEQEP